MQIIIGSKWHRLGPTGRPNTRVTCEVIRLTPGYVYYTATCGDSIVFGDYPLSAFHKVFAPAEVV